MLPIQSPKRNFGGSRLKFTGEQLMYSYPDGAASVLRVVEAQDGTIVTEQPSSPRVERTSYTSDATGRLLLYFNGRRSLWIRSSYI